MKFCILSPTGGLERYSSLSSCHLVLPQVKNPNYWKYYEQCRELGYFIILDNGAYETKHANWDELIPWIGLLKPDIVVLPDVIGEPWPHTWGQACDWIRNHEEDRQRWGFEWLFIPQTTDRNMKGFVDCMSRAFLEEKIRWIGLPRALVDRYSEDPMVRVEMCQLCIQAGKKVHAFGYGSNLSELKYLDAEGCQSMDSSAPVWRGWNSYRIDAPGDVAGWKRDGIKCDFETNDCPEPGSVTDKVIKYNLEAVGVNVDPLTRT